MTHHPLALLEQALTAGHLSTEAAANIRHWLASEDLASFRTEIEALLQAADWRELEDAFYTVLPFGTGGRRGPRGAGPNRINLRTIGESAQGLAAYISKVAPQDKARGVVISYDTRHMSTEFAETCAAILAGNGVRAYLFAGPRSTPELSFAVRHLGTVAGIMISASHNPPRDNGIKVSWRDGGQVLPPHDEGIIAEVKAASHLHSMLLEEAVADGLVVLVGEEVDRAYLDANHRLVRSTGRGLRVVYTPLHGVGGTNILPALQRAGVEVLPVAEQMTPDPDFSHVANRSPNPEYPEALREGIALAEREGLGLVLASDPDADRLGAAVFLAEEDRPEPAQHWLPLTGNQIGALCVAWWLSRLHETGELPSNGLLVKTCVTTELLTAIGREYGVETVRNLPVGFKYIAEIIEQLDDPARYLFGMEESHGFLAGPWVRDKDAAHAALLLAQLAADLHAVGSDLTDYLCDLWRRFGVFVEHTESITMPGRDGAEQIAAMLQKLRSAPPCEIAGRRVFRVIDRKRGVAFAPEQPGAEQRYEDRGYRSNIIVLEITADSTESLTIRPSGTEPKVKIYAMLRRELPAGASNREALLSLEQGRSAARGIISTLVAACRG